METKIHMYTNQKIDATFSRKSTRRYSARLHSFAHIQIFIRKYTLIRIHSFVGIRLWANECVQTIIHPSSHPSHSLHISQLFYIYFTQNIGYATPRLQKGKVKWLKIERLWWDRCFKSRRVPRHPSLCCTCSSSVTIWTFIKAGEASQWLMILRSGPSNS